MAKKPADKPTAREARTGEGSLPASVFVSYSRRDTVLVHSLLDLYRAIDVPTFVDETSIKPGQKWRIAIDAALEQCDVILVFWCEHAARSSEVRNEYERAISLDKRVVPVLVDHTVLPDKLGQYQFVDLRKLSEGHRSLEQEDRVAAQHAQWWSWWPYSLRLQLAWFPTPGAIGLFVAVVVAWMIARVTKHEFTASLLLVTGMALLVVFTVMNETLKTVREPSMRNDIIEARQQLEASLNSIL
jgi:hypothetical protein